MAGRPAHGRRRFAWPALLLGGLALLGGALGAPARADAQTPGLELSLTTNQPVFATGETLRVSAGLESTGVPVVADFYLGVRLPDGDTVVFFAGPGLTPEFGRLSQLATLRPLQAGVSLGTAFAAAGPDLFAYTWTGTEPFGQYVFFLAAVTPGGLTDNRVDAGDLLGLATASITLGPSVAISVDASQAASALITRAGGTVQTTDPGGRVYTLSVPPGALAETTTITLTPLASLGNLPFHGTPVAGIQAGPPGLSFQLPATLTVDVPGGVPPGVVAFTAQDDGTGFEWLLFATEGNQLHFAALTHFSTVAAAIPANFAELRNLIGYSGFKAQANALFNIAGSSPPPPGSVEALGTHLARWYDGQIRGPLQRLAGPDTADRPISIPALLAAADEFALWDGTRQFSAGVHAQLAGRFVARGQEGRDLLVSAFVVALERTRRRCVDERRLALAEDGLRLQSLAQSLFDYLGRTVSIPNERIPSPDLAAVGLDRATAIRFLCVVVLISAEFPSNPQPGTPATLTVRAGHFFVFTITGQLIFTPALTVTVDATRTTPRNAVGLTDASGLFVTTFTPTGVNPVLRIQAVLNDFVNFPFLGAGALFRTLTVPAVRVSPSPATVASGQSQQFSAVVEAVTDQRVTWSVTGADNSITQTGLLTAGPTPGTFEVRARSVADVDSVGTAQVTITPRRVVVSPSPATVDVCVDTPEELLGLPKVQFSAVVEGLADQRVFWAISGDFSQGTNITQTGLLTVDTATSPLFVTATSQADPSLIGAAQVAIVGCPPPTTP